MSKTWCIVTALLSALASAELAGQQGRTNEGMTLETLRQRVAENEKLLDPIKLNYTVKLSRTGESPARTGKRIAGRSYSHFNVIWAQRDSRQYVERHNFYGPNEPAQDELMVSDGKTRMQVDLPERMRAVIDSAGNDNTEWYNILTAKLRLRPFEDQCLLSELLVPACATLQHEPQRVGGRPAYVVDVTRPEQYTCVRLWIDPEAGIPLRTRVYDQHPDAPGAQPIVEVNDIRPYRLPNGGWFPVSGVRALHFRRTNPPYTSYEHIAVDVNSITTEPGRIPLSLFEVDLPQGATISNLLTSLTTTKGQTPKTYEQFVASGGKYIAGIVMDEQGTPLAGAVVTRAGIETVQSNGSPGLSKLVQPWEQISTTTDVRGRFALEVVEEANHELLVSHVGFVDRGMGGVAPDEHNLTVTLSKGGTITGRVLWATQGTKTPLGGVEVVAQAGGNLMAGRMRTGRVTTTDAQGRFEIPGLLTQMRDRSAPRVGPPQYMPLPWRVRCGPASQSVTFEPACGTREVELVLKPDVRMAPPLAGRPLPGFDGLGLHVDPQQLKGRRVLVCFFDWEQRPARNCVEELAQRADALQKQGVTILAVQAQAMDAGNLKAWMEKSGITFPVGALTGDPDEVKFAWAVRSLPWLILTDKDHIVRQEGFTIDELDKQWK